MGAGPCVPGCAGHDPESVGVATCPERSEGGTGNRPEARLFTPYAVAESTLQRREWENDLIPRDERIARITELLDQRRHPERRVGLFSATNLTRLALRFGAMAFAAALVQGVFGANGVGAVLTLVAVAAADWGVAQLWARIGDQVRRGYNTLGIVLACAVMLLFVMGQAKPDSFLVRTIKGGASGWIDRKNAELDRKNRSRMIPVSTEKSGSDHWQLIVDNRGSVAQGTLKEAREWCRGLGAEWNLPPTFDQWPRLESYPDVGTLFYVWSRTGAGIQVGDGKRPAVMTSGGTSETTTRGVLCLMGVP